jgi:hypothetical protein
MKLKPLILLAAGFGLYAVSHSVGLQGDAAPFAEQGVSTERATYHFMALMLLVGALACFITAGVGFFRR